jgi:hypothetical protein
VASRKRTTAKPPTAAQERQLLRRHPAVWLATLSTVVGVATGMFTLRDQVFPREAGTAAAVPVSVYEQRVGSVCDEVNDNDRRRARDEKTIRRQLQRAKTTIAQRNALLDGVRRATTRAGQTLASFSALQTPAALVAISHDTEALWSRNLARSRDYAMSLERAGSRAQLLAALEHLSTLRPALARDGDKIRSGLQRLGAASCDLEAPIVIRTFTLPQPQKKERKAAPASSGGGGTSAAGTPPAAGTQGAGAPPVNAPPVNAPPANAPPANAPPANAPPANTPPANRPPANTGPITGGGGED